MIEVAADSSLYSLEMVVLVEVKADSSKWRLGLVVLCGDESGEGTPRASIVQDCLYIFATYEYTGCLYLHFPCEVKVRGQREVGAGTDG